MANINTQLRRGILIGVPIVLGAIELTHPFIGPNADITDRIAPMSTWWTTIHVLQIPLFALLAAGVLLLLRDLRGLGATVARYCAVAFGLLYPAFDAAVGVASGVIIAAAPSPKSAELETSLHALFWGPVTGMIDILAALCWVVATVLTALLLRKRQHAPIWASILLVISGITLAIGHVPPFGPIACFSFAIAASSLELRQSTPTVLSA